MEAFFLKIGFFFDFSINIYQQAAREIKKRISEIVGSAEAKKSWMGAFPSVFAGILRSEPDKLGYPNNFTIYDRKIHCVVFRGLSKKCNNISNAYYSVGEYKKRTL